MHRKTESLVDSCHAWTQSPPDLELFATYGAMLGDVNDMRVLPFGSTKDPVKKLELNVTWNNLPEDMVIENDVHTDFEPLEAPLWTITITFEEQPNCLLSE